MSCSLCHYISGHDPSCRHYHEDAAQDQADLRSRVEALEQKVERLIDRITDYAHLKKLYADSRDYVQTLVGERDDLMNSNRRLVAHNNHLDAMIDRLRNAVVGTRGLMLGVVSRAEVTDDVRALLNTEAAALAQLLTEIPHER
jgi:hypothetical protein